MIVLSWYPGWRSAPVQPEGNPRHDDDQAWRDVHLEYTCCYTWNLEVLSMKIGQTRQAMINQGAGWANTLLEKLAHLSDLGANEGKLRWSWRWWPKLLQVDKIISKKHWSMYNPLCWLSLISCWMVPVYLYWNSASQYTFQLIFYSISR